MDRFDLFERRESDGLTLLVARTRRARLVGLTLVAQLPREVGLLIPNCRAVHTFGMRFSLDLLWLDAASEPIRIDRGVRPGRFRSCRTATSVLELVSPNQPRRRVAPGGS